MPKNNCLFQARWLQDEWFKHRIRFKHWIQTVAICNYFSKGVSVANMEKAALTSHMKGKKHIERSPNQCIKSLMSPTPAPPQPWESVAAFSNTVVNAILCWFYDGKKNAVVKIFTYAVFLFSFYSVVGNS